MIRDLTQLAEREFDVLVIGGGIYGLAIAYDAAQRGLAVALIERGDFGAATSFNHLKTIHGGLRYLQSGDLQRIRESIRERRAFARIAPKFVAPQAFALPAGGSLTRSALALTVALGVDALIARDRNDAVGSAHRLPRGHVIRGPQTAEIFGGATEPPAAAAVWYDYVVTRGDRLTLSFAKAAFRCGAVMANYVEALGPLRKADRSAIVEVRDNLSGAPFAIQSRIVISAAGPWTATLFAPAASALRWPLLKAMNLVTTRPAPPAALVVPTRAGRALVLLPWMGRTLIGTSESTDERRADDQAARRDEVNAFVEVINDTYPRLRLRPEEISLVHRGIVPGKQVGGRLTLLDRPQIVDHSAHGIPELVSVAGVKFTTARAVAERVVDLLLEKLGRAPVPCRTADTALPDAGLDDREPDDPVIHAIRNEMAQHVSDVVLRRTGLGGAGHPGDDVALDVARTMQRELEWPDARVQGEVAALREFYAISG